MTKESNSQCPYDILHFDLNILVVLIIFLFILKMLTPYRKYIEDLANNRSTEEFYNSDLNHAKIVLANMFRIAENKVRVFCKDMLSEVNSDSEYLKQVGFFLERGGEVDVLLHNYTDELKDKAIWKLLDSYIKEGKVRVHYNNGKGFRNSDGNFVHFTVVDNMAYRFEFDIENKQARGFFNSPEDAKYLVDAFDKVFDSNTTVVN